MFKQTAFALALGFAALTPAAFAESAPNATAQIKTVDGFGFVISEENNQIVISHVLIGSPAERNGKIRAGDVVVSIAEEGKAPVALGGVGKDAAAQLLRGAPGSKVKLDMLSGQDKKPVSIELVRERIEIKGFA